MTAILAATIIWCLDHADDDPASDCGLTEPEVWCIDSCLSDNDHYTDDHECVAMCIEPSRIEQIQTYPLYQGK